MEKTSIALQALKNEIRNGVPSNSQEPLEFVSDQDRKQKEAVEIEKIADIILNMLLQDIIDEKKKTL